MSLGYNYNYNIQVPSLTTGNFVSTNITVGNIFYTGNLIQNGTVSSVLGSSNNFIATNLTASTLNAGNLTTGNINFTGTLSQNGTPYLGSQWTTTAANLSYTSGNVIINNLTTGNLNFTGTLSQNGSPYIGSQWTNTSGSAISYTSGNVVASNANITSLSSANITLSGNMTVGGNLLVLGTLTSVNITTINLIDNNISAGTLNAISATIPNLTTTNICTGTLNAATSISTANISTQNNTTVNLFTTSITSSNIRTTNLLSTNNTLTNSIFTNFTVGTLLANNVNLGISSLFSGSFVAANNVSTPTDVTGIIFNNTNVNYFEIKVSLSIVATVNLTQTYNLYGNFNASGWSLFTNFIGDTTGVVFSITAGGQIQYTSTNVAGWVSDTFRYTVQQFSASGTYSSLAGVTQGNYIFDTVQVTSTTDSILGTSTGGVQVLGGATIAKQVNIQATGVAVGLGTGGSLSVFGGAAISANAIIGSGITSAFNSNTIGNLFTTGGNIGIGNANPGFTLDVSGTGRFNGTTRIINTTATSMGTLIVNGPGATNYSPATTTIGSLATFYGPSGVNVISNFDLSTFVPQASSIFLPAVRFSITDLLSANNSFNILTRNGGNGTGSMASRIFIDGNGTININNTGNITNYSTNMKMIISNDATGTHASDSGQLIICGATDQTKRLGIAIDTTNNVGILQGGKSGTTTYNIALNPGGSNVGINTTAPSFTLDVAGTSRIIGSGNSQTNGTLLLIGSDYYGHTLCIDSTGDNKRTVLNHNGTFGNLFCFDYNTLTPQNLCLNFAGANVGIRENNPLFTLDLNGTFRSQNTIWVNNTVNNITNTIGSNNFSSDITLSNSTRNSVLFNSVGVSPPTFTTRSIGSKVILYPIIGGSSLDYSLGVETNAMWFSSASGFKWYSNSTSSNMIFNSTGLAINTDNVTANYALDITGAGNFTGTIIGRFNSNTIGNLFTTGGNVGINTTAPSFTLDVAGTGRFNGHVYLTTGSLRSPSTAAVMYPLVANDTSTFTTSTNGLNGIGSYNLGMVRDAGGYQMLTLNCPNFVSGAGAGLGTVSPDGTFTPAVSVSRFGDTYIGTLGQGSSYYWDRFGNLFTPSIYSTFMTTGNLAVSNNITVSSLLVSGGSLRATFNSNTLGNIFTTGGNVGIGTSTPTSALHVNGNIRNTGYNLVNSSTLTTGSAGTVLFATGNAGLYSGRFQVNAIGGGGHSSFTIDVSGCYTEEFSTQTPTISVKRTQWTGGTNVTNITICTAPNNFSYLSTFFLTCTSGVALTVTLLENVNQMTNITLNTLALTTLTAGYSQIVYPLSNTAILHGGMGNYISVNNTGVDINGTITRSGVRLPRFDNGTFTSSTQANIPILFSGSTYNYVEIKVSYFPSTITNVIIGGGSGSFLITAKETITRYDQSPTTTAIGLISQNAEIQSFRVTANIQVCRENVNGRHYFMSESAYCLTNVGSTRISGMGLLLINPLTNVTLTPSSGNITGSWSTVHSY